MNAYTPDFPLEQATKSNVGTADRVIRILAGLVLLSLVFILESDVRWWGLAGLLPLATGLAGSCPLYVPFGIDTRCKGHCAAADRTFIRSE